ncbi:phage head-tail adaptor, putative family protein [Trichomonas vaginalis G3]|uniref:Phage head-tail adaptor, putative family protein n=1 Tax=Trichomonas vaginalis (strain ATCC PRA-98 / G3) TaxID=412133 RepID=A2FX26_TRIV3|nr:phage head-tail adaptor family protein [Trichomonas vaginalis G3]EAX90548.1 phage head-tail adaptor, putative family protein [Trichomonas vaginalis G3]KAI5497739.1 hypothetical protein TVAGG3_0819100 [Trichomonas vaginalis G3]|eukprot:XP_001303478.1 phage head-tail adaptor family protein [Trichomonas vaginalis G3]
MPLSDDSSQEKQLSDIRQDKSFGDEYNFYVLTPIEDEDQEISQIIKENDHSQIILLPNQPDLDDISVNEAIKSESHNDFVKFRFIDKIGQNEFDLEVKSNQKMESLDLEIISRCKFRQHKVEYILTGRKIQPDEIASNVFLRNRRKRPIYVFETPAKLEDAQNSTEIQSISTEELPSEEKLNNFYSRVKKKFEHNSFICLIPYTIGPFFTYYFDGDFNIDEILIFLYKEFQTLLDYEICILDKDSQLIETNKQNNQILFYGRIDKIPDKLPNIIDNLTTFITLHQKSKEIYDKIQEEFKQNKQELVKQIWIRLNSLNSQLYNLEDKVKKFYKILEESSQVSQKTTSAITETTKKAGNINLNVIITDNIDNESNFVQFTISVSESSTFNEVTSVIYKEHQELANCKFDFRDSQHQEIWKNQKVRSYANQKVYAITDQDPAKIKTLQDNLETKFIYDDCFNASISIKSSETQENIEKQLCEFFNCSGPVKFEFSPDITNGLKNIREVNIKPLNGIHLYLELSTLLADDNKENLDAVLEYNTPFVEIFNTLIQKGVFSSVEENGLVFWKERDVSQKCPNDIGIKELEEYRQIEITSSGCQRISKEITERLNKEEDIQQVMLFTGVDKKEAMKLVVIHGDANSAINSYLDSLKN